jgi:hypothetical protein
MADWSSLAQQEEEEGLASERNEREMDLPAVGNKWRPHCLDCRERAILMSERPKGKTAC